jgi:hypothetical protein
MNPNIRAVLTILGVICLITGFAMLKPALGFLSAGVLFIVPTFLVRR